MINSSKRINREKSQLLRLSTKASQYKTIDLKITGKYFYLSLLEKKNGLLTPEDYYRVIKRYSEANNMYSYYELKKLYDKYKNDKTL